MPTASREYIAAATIGSADRCEEFRQSLGDEFSRRRADGRCVGYWIRILFSVECALDEILEPDELDALTGGVYPVVWFNYTYNPARVSAGELAELESTFGLRLYAEADSEVTYE